MILLPLLAVVALVSESGALLVPGPWQPEIEDDGFSLAPWQNDEGISVVPWEDDGISVVPWQNVEFASAKSVECAAKPKTQTLKPGKAIQIQSPDYPKNYPTKSCGWKVKVVGTNKVKVTCTKFQMEAPTKKGKCKDFLQIGTKKSRFCGKNGPVDVTISVNKLLKLTFKSNKKKSGSGFSCTVTALPNEVTATTKPTEKTTTMPTEKPTTKPTTTERPAGCRCGQKGAGTRIVNGKETGVLEYPWQVGLVRTGNWRTGCGGSLINSNWVLTAAHCTVGKSPSSIQVLLGEHDLTVTEYHQERFNVKRIINHPSYDTYPWRNGHDISLLELQGRVNFETSYARPICLPTGNNDYNRSTAIITGFGKTGHDQPQSNYLQEADPVWVIANYECSMIYGGSEADYYTMICAGNLDGTGGCMGDSGGPLITKENGTNHYVQIGVTSFGSSLCNTIGVYARVTDLRDWIISYTSTGSPDTCSP